MFSGCEAWSKELRRRGYGVYSFDILQGPDGDVLRKPVQSRIRRMLSSGSCLGLLAGVPCTSFSIAAGRFRPLRSKTCPMGLPDLPERLQEKVVLGNELLRVSLSFFRYCKRYSVPFLWENPASSYQWRTAAAEEVRSWDHSTEVLTHYCGWGARWKKATRFMCFQLPNAIELHKKCTSLTSVCVFTNKEHIRLEGKDDNGINWTARAAAYPKALAHMMVNVFEDAAFTTVFGYNLGNYIKKASVNNQAIANNKKYNKAKQLNLSYVTARAASSSFPPTTPTPPSR